MIITSSEELKKRIEKLSNEEFVTVDTEFLREKTYYSKLCLVQIAGENDAFAVDVLSDIDLSSLYELFNNTSVIKVFHACKQDLELLLQCSKRIPEPVIDTQIAAQILGYGESVSYGNLVQKICNVDLDKSCRYTDWAKRPLSNEQIDYAVSDVTYLRKVYLHLIQELNKTKRTDWLAEEMNKISNPEIYHIDPDEVWRKIRMKSNSPKFLSIVKELAKWRELKAQNNDKPRQWIMKDDAILEIASISPKSIDDLVSLRFFNTKNTKTKDEILKVVKEALVATPPTVIKKHKISTRLVPVVELLKVLLKKQCSEHNISPSVIARTEDLEKIAEGSDTPSMHGWRFDIFGKYATMLKDGKLIMTVDKNRVIIRADSD